MGLVGLVCLLSEVVEARPRGGGVRRGLSIACWIDCDC